MMMARKTKGLSERHKKILEFIENYQDQTGYPPSIREIGKKTGISSTSVVNYYLDQLQNMGLIERDRHISRGVRLMTTKANDVIENVVETAKKAANAVEELMRIPVMGRIVASAPAPVPTSGFNYYDAESSVEIARSMLPARETSELFALEVQGDSMIDAMVNEGDYVILRRAEKANNGDMVAVWLPERDETTLKYFYKETNGYRLQPANPTMQPIYLDKKEKLEIRGKVVMIVRQVKTM